MRANKLVGCGAIFYVLIVLLLVIGEIQCIYKAINSDWNPIGKREIIYTGASLTGLGAVVGWFNIPDEPAK